ncbi:Replication protein O [Candidatus Pantoea deserta]|uniref:Replication protein O n=1 Tax=Candidatus Pantoea deserta TaxID=1869313 RepID=A0A3N4PEL4_9GAMM|nr:replication protein [Pantoea deserta]RPE02967.1 Replication protein O [Pantoea deserta]
MNLAYDNVSPIRPELRAVERRVADLEDGYTRIANELLEAVMLAGMTQHQLLVFMAVMRKTYGFNKKVDWVSNEQLSQLTGMLPHKCSAAKSALVKRNILTQEGRLTGINKELNEWENEPYPKKVNLPESGKKCLPESGNRSYPNRVTTKDNITKDKKDIKHTSENSGESSDERLKSLPVVRPEAAVHSQKGDKWGTADDLLAAQWIFSRVQVITPTAQQPNWPAWANDIRLMRDSLKTSHREICEVFTWANGNQFWQTNILSPSKLRKQWATLKAQMSQPVRNAPSSSQQQVPHWNDRREWEENFI